jgi:thiol-disulfide isomerase/thioredoxin
MRIIYFLTVIVPIVFCSCEHSSSIHGHVAGASGKTIYLESLSDNEVNPLDSTTLDSDGNFSLKGLDKLPLDNYRLYFDNEHYIQLIVSSSDVIEINGDYNNLLKSEVKGSAETVELQSLLTKYEVFAQRMAEAQLMYESDTTELGKNTAQVNFEKANKESNDMLKAWLETHSGSLLSLIAVQNLDPRFDFQWYTRVLADAKANFQSSPAYQNLEKKVAVLKNKVGKTSPGGKSSNIAVGEEAPEIALSNPSGGITKLSSLRGKIVLIDFWASWCRPCRAENPNVVKVYQAYKQKGFEVFSVSLDEDRAKWMQAVREDGLIWNNHVSDLAGWNSSVVPLYKIESIPFPVLIDQQGKIVALGESLRGKGLESKLKSLGL